MEESYKYRIDYVERIDFYLKRWKYEVTIKVTHNLRSNLY